MTVIFTSLSMAMFELDGCATPKNFESLSLEIDQFIKQYKLQKPKGVQNHDVKVDYPSTVQVGEVFKITVTAPPANDIEACSNDEHLILLQDADSLGSFSDVWQLEVTAVESGQADGKDGEASITIAFSAEGTCFPSSSDYKVIIQA